jgi:acetyltransferase-like isoleucine patch superfamily enzyme
MWKSQDHRVTGEKYSFVLNPINAIKKIIYFIPIIFPLPSSVSARIFQLGGVKFKDPTKVFIGYNCWLDSGSPSHIHIGEHVILGAGTKIVTHSAPTYLLKDKFPVILKEVKLKDGVLIGINSIILPGVTLGECSVVAAGSVVTSDVEPYTVVGGNPAKLTKRIEFEENGAPKR